MTRHRRDAAQIWAASAIVLGITLALLSWFGMQPQMPTQDAAVIGPSSSSSVAAGAGQSGDGGGSTSLTNESGSSKPATSAVGYSPIYAKRPRYASKVGTITLPTLKLSWPIYEGTTASQLARGVGHFRQSVLPGENNNSVLSGHRSTVFNRLGQLRRGNLIYVKTSAGIFSYKVRNFRIVKRTDRSVIVPTKTAVLTLTTCWPFDHIGTTTQAYIVSADLVASKLSER